MMSYYNSAFNWINTLDRQEWLMALVAVVVIGLFCLKGFGSRSGY